MADYVIAALSLLVALVVLMLRKAYFNYPPHELRRQVVQGNQFAHLIYPLASLPVFRALLWLIMATCSSLAVIMFNRRAPLLLGWVAAVTWLWLAFSWIPNRKVSQLNQRVAKTMTPFFMWLLHWSYPLVKQLARVQDRYEDQHTHVYDKEDLLELLRRQERQGDNRISSDQLARLDKLISFEEARVVQYMIPWKKSMKLTKDELIGPKLLDEMHNSEQTAFVVVASKNNPHIVGFLSSNAVGLHSNGKVGDFMNSKVEAISENTQLENALMQFAEASVPMLIVIGRQNETVGTITLKEVLNALLVKESETKDQEDSGEQELEDTTDNLEEGAIAK